MRLHLNGELVSEEPSAADVGQALHRMTGRDDVLTLSRPPAAFVQATGCPTHGFVLSAYDETRSASRATARRLDTRSAADALSRYLGGDARWGDALSWAAAVPPRPRGWRSLGAGAIALAIFGGALVAAMIVSEMGDAPGRPTRADWLRGLGAVVALSAYIAWLDGFFRVLRPRVARWLGARMGMRVEESIAPVDAGTWHATGGSLGARLLVPALDLLLLLAGVMAPLAVPAVAAVWALGR